MEFSFITHDTSGGRNKELGWVNVCQLIRFTENRNQTRFCRRISKLGSVQLGRYIVSILFTDYHADGPCTMPRYIYMYKNIKKSGCLVDDDIVSISPSVQLIYLKIFTKTQPCQMNRHSYKTSSAGTSYL